MNILIIHAVMKYLHVLVLNLLPAIFHQDSSVGGKGIIVHFSASHTTHDSENFFYVPNVLSNVYSKIKHITNYIHNLCPTSTLSILTCFTGLRKLLENNKAII